MANSFTATLQGYWNAKGDNVFVYVGADEEEGTFVIVPGRYDSEPGGTWIIDKLDKQNGTQYVVHVHSLYDSSNTRTFTFDLAGVPDAKIKFESYDMHYADLSFEKAYDDYIKNK